MDKEYVVTLHRKEDLEQFYNEMQLTNFPLVKKRPLSRNTHYMMTEEQAERLRQDSRVWGVEAVDSFKFATQVVNNESYPVSGNFWKDDTQGAATVSPGDLQWGHIHCAGDAAQRGKGQFGPITSGGIYEQVNDTVEVFNNGRHVDVVIVDDPVSWDSQEWFSPTTGATRFVQYQWFNELNSLVNTIDDDAQSEPTGTIVYGDNQSTPQFHGIHVTGTACGQHYGWARESNIYNIAITDTWPSGQQVPPLLIFDYLRAFHRSKPINPETGKKNPTVTNHSYGGIYFMPNEENLLFSDVTNVNYQGVNYNSGNPGPSGWSQAGVENDFGIRFNLNAYPAWSSAVAADVQDAIDEGIVVIGAAGNDNLLMAEVNDINWNNSVTITGVGTIPYNRGAWPNSPDSGAINVGALNKREDFRRSSYTQFGPGVDVFAPGDNILSAYGNTGLDDTKYPVPGNYFYPIQGTSMASPQVCGVAACLASARDRFTNDDVLGYLQDHSIFNDMTFDTAGGTYSDSTCSFNSPDKYLHSTNPRPETGYLLEQVGKRETLGMIFPRVDSYYKQSPGPVPLTFNLNVTNSGASHYVFNGDDRVTTWVDANDPSISLNAGDKIVLNLNASGHPFFIKTVATTGTGNQVTTGTVTGQGTSIGTVTWDTNGVAPGTYYYICQFHSGMVGTIVIS